MKNLKKNKKIHSCKVKKIKYDLCLQEDEETEEIIYLNRKKWSKIKRNRELVDEEFGKKIELILQNELELNDLTWEELNDYGEFRWNDKEDKDKEYERFQKLNGAEIELVKVEDFYHHVLSGTHQDGAIELTRKYFTIFDGASALKKKIKEEIDEKETSLTPWTEKVKEKYLNSHEPTLTEKELDKPGEANPIKKLERAETQLKIAERKGKEKKVAELNKKIKSSLREVNEIVESTYV